MGYCGMFIVHDGPPMNNHLLLVTEETESQSQGKSEGETQKESQTVMGEVSSNKDLEELIEKQLWKKGELNIEKTN